MSYCLICKISITIGIYNAITLTILAILNIVIIPACHFGTTKSVLTTRACLKTKYCTNHFRVNPKKAKTERDFTLF